MDHGDVFLSGGKFQFKEFPFVLIVPAGRLLAYPQGYPGAISTGSPNSSAKMALPPGFKFTSMTKPNAVFERPTEKNCIDSR